MSVRVRIVGIGAVAAVLSAILAFAGAGGAFAQQQQPQPQPQQQQGGQWAKLPRMQLERQFAGPLQDTIVQRWRDPADGTVCYIYLPITAAHSAPTASGFVEYGSNGIGTISCFEPAPAPAAAPKKPAPERH